MIEMWLILAGAFTVLYLIAMLVIGPWKTQSLISALMLGPLAATVATALVELPPFNRTQGYCD